MNMQQPRPIRVRTARCGHQQCLENHHCNVRECYNYIGKCQNHKEQS